MKYVVGKFAKGENCFKINSYFDMEQISPLHISPLNEDARIKSVPHFLEIFLTLRPSKIQHGGRNSLAIKINHACLVNISSFCTYFLVQLFMSLSFNLMFFFKLVFLVFSLFNPSFLTWPCQGDQSMLFNYFHFFLYFIH